MKAVTMELARILAQRGNPLDWESPEAFAEAVVSKYLSDPHSRPVDDPAALVEWVAYKVAPAFENVDLDEADDEPPAPPPTRWSMVLDDRGGHDGSATGGHYGPFARIWASREGIATVAVTEEKHTVTPGVLTFHHDYVTVEVALTEHFDPERDFVIVEQCRDYNPFLLSPWEDTPYPSPLARKCRLLAGVRPDWVESRNYTVPEGAAVLLMSPRKLYESH